MAGFSLIPNRLTVTTLHAFRASKRAIGYAATHRQVTHANNVTNVRSPTKRKPYRNDSRLLPWNARLKTWAGLVTSTVPQSRKLPAQEGPTEKEIPLHGSHAGEGKVVSKKTAPPSESSSSICYSVKEKKDDDKRRAKEEKPRRQVSDSKQHSSQQEFKRPFDKVTPKKSKMDFSDDRHAGKGTKMVPSHCNREESSTNKAGRSENPPPSSRQQRCLSGMVLSFNLFDSASLSRGYKKKYKVTTDVNQEGTGHSTLFCRLQRSSKGSNDLQRSNEGDLCKLLCVD